MGRADRSIAPVIARRRQIEAGEDADPSVAGPVLSRSTDLQN
jgi:hypothetical protein